MAVENPNIIILKKKEKFASKVLPIDAELLETPFPDSPFKGLSKNEGLPSFFRPRSRSERNTILRVGSWSRKVPCTKRKAWHLVPERNR